ncbi:MAG: hypothetical protein A3I66_01485 [Burkholderiales bacterium RIFCSPLOWO2_02_FULL_57_36]|nr:MAG: hypothetical protein A3I66_01485 [Burkholderiales bacterium RIFCSPLOWO2_02_FULL_57_36]
MIALSKLAAAILGTNTLANGLPCTATSPASMSVSIGVGEIYALANIDGTAYSSIAADTTHTILKQGIKLDSSDLACAAPGTVGHSINYLIQAAFSEVDGTPIVLPYYNASNPASAYAGPNNTGVAENTNRAGTVVVSAKAGISATTGAQTTPSPDAGYVGLWVVTVANGATTITSGNIAQAASAPFIATTLANLAPLASPVLSGVPTAPTAAVGTNTTQLATTAFAVAEILNQFTKSGQQSLATNGYQIFPGGLIRQWGKVTGIITSGDFVQPITFPFAFPNALYGVHPTLISIASSVAMSVYVTNETLSGADIVIDKDGTEAFGVSLYYEAWGK